MTESLLMQTSFFKLDSALLASLLPSIILRDFKIKKSGIYCIFNLPISQIQEIIKTFLTSLYEVTGAIFYYEIVNEQEAILKVYSMDGLKFSKGILYNSLASSLERDER